MSSFADRRRLLVSAARSDGPSVADRDRIRLALAARLGGAAPPDGASASGPSPAPAPGPGPVSPAAKGLAASPAGGLAGLIGAVGAGSVAALAVAAFLTVRPVGAPAEDAPPPARVERAEGRADSVARDALGSDATRSEAGAPPGEASASSPAPVLDLDAEPVQAPNAPSVKARSVHRSPTTSVSMPHGAAPSNGGLAEEVELLRRAREATRDGDGARALAVLDDLERRQPDGVLGEERRASRIVALCASERAEEGREAARTFLSEMPSSIHAERVRAACARRAPR